MWIPKMMCKHVSKFLNTVTFYKYLFITTHTLVSIRPTQMTSLSMGRKTQTTNQQTYTMLTQLFNW